MVVLSIRYEATMHTPVMVDEVLAQMDIKPGGCYIDATVGGGGHSEAVLQRVGAKGFLLCVDRDQDALTRATLRLGEQFRNFVTEQGDFRDLAEIAARRAVEHVDGVIMDLGMSSDQVDDAQRGFSFMREGPLDMRMDRTQMETAFDLVNEESPEHLAELLKTFGEERQGRRIARAIVDARRRKAIETTTELAEIVARVKGGRRGRQHPATQTFQALRMAVNDELESISKGLEAALALVRPGGRVGVISFHSIEDRLVKQCFARHVGQWQSLPEGGQRWSGVQPAARRITRKPVSPGAEEIDANPRARSAKLRVIERMR